MKSDALFFLGIIVFFFILWYASGGPTKPISFAGPYISPITNVDSVQEGYGDTSAGTGSGSVWIDIMGLQDSVANLQRSASQIRAFGDASPLKGQVTVISTGGVYATDPDQEYVIITASGDKPVDITGWSVMSGSSHDSERIPRGSVIPTFGSTGDAQDIVLNPGDQAIIVTGESPIGVSFKENMCTGYLSDTQDFYPGLQGSCPSASGEFDRFYTGDPIRDDTCYNLMQSTQSCEVPRDIKRMTAACIALIDQHLTYKGCVATHRYDAQFSSNIWHIYLEHENDKRKPEELWRSTRDSVKLLDKDGKTVDLYTY